MAACTCVCVCVCVCVLRARGSIAVACYVLIDMCSHLQSARVALAAKLREASRPLAAVADPKRPHVTVSLKVGDDERTHL